MNTSSHKNLSQDGKNLSSGLFMTVWQQMPIKPEIQIMARQQEEIIELQSKLSLQAEHLEAVEKKLDKIEISYKSLLRTIKHIIGD